MYKDILFKDDIENKENSTIEQKEEKLNESANNIADLFDLKDIKQKYSKMYKQSVDHLGIEADIYDDIFDMSFKLQESVKGTKLETFDKLSRDIFLSLFKYQPVINKVEDMTPATQINNKILRDLVKTKEFKELRENCTLDEFASSIGTTIFNEKAKVIIEEWVKKNEKNSSNMDTINKLDKAENKLKNAIDQGDEKKAKASAKQMKDLMNKLNKNATNGLGKALGEAAKEANKDVNETKEAMANWGIGDGDDSKRISYKEKKNAIERIRSSEKLKKMSNLIGRMKDTAIKDLKRRSTENGHTIKSVTTGNDISKLLQTEKGKLLNPTTKKDFYKRYNEKQLFQFECENDYMKSKGPIIVVNDGSGSMKGEKEIWSKAVAIAMLEIAHKEKRDFAYILFTSKVNAVIEIPRLTFDAQKVLDIAEKFPGGGTKFTPALDRAMELLDKSKFKKADILFITDGEDYGVSYEFKNRLKKEKEKKQFKMFGVCVSVDGKDANIRSIQELCDDTVTISELNSMAADSDVSHKIFKFGIGGR